MRGANRRLDSMHVRTACMNPIYRGRPPAREAGHVSPHLDRRRGGATVIGLVDLIDLVLSIRAHQQEVHTWRGGPRNDADSTALGYPARLKSSDATAAPEQHTRRVSDPTQGQVEVRDRRAGGHGPVIQHPISRAEARAHPRGGGWVDDLADDE